MAVTSPVKTEGARMLCVSLGAGKLDLSRVLSCILNPVLVMGLVGASIPHAVSPDPLIIRK